MSFIDGKEEKVDGGGAVDPWGGDGGSVVDPWGETGSTEWLNDYARLARADKLTDRDGRVEGVDR